LSILILSCIDEESAYWIKSERLNPIILTISGNTLLITETKSCLVMQTVGTLLSVVIGYFLHTSSVGILLMIILLDETGKGGFDCERYFEKLPKH
jgi:hypothetical protein